MPVSFIVWLRYLMSLMLKRIINPIIRARISLLHFLQEIESIMQCCRPLCNLLSNSRLIIHIKLRLEVILNKISGYDLKHTTVTTHQLHKTNTILNTFSLNMCCINSTLSLLNSSVKAKGPVNNLPHVKQY